MPSQAPSLSLTSSPPFHLTSSLPSHPNPFFPMLHPSCIIIIEIPIHTLPLLKDIFFGQGNSSSSSLNTKPIIPTSSFQLLIYCKTKCQVAQVTEELHASFLSHHHMKEEEALSGLQPSSSSPSSPTSSALPPPFLLLSIHSACSDNDLVTFKQILSSSSSSPHSSPSSPSSFVIVGTSSICQACDFPLLSHILVLDVPYTILDLLQLFGRATRNQQMSKIFLFSPPPPLPSHQPPPVSIFLPLLSFQNSGSRVSFVGVLSLVPFSRTQSLQHCSIILCSKSSLLLVLHQPPDPPSLLRLLPPLLLPPLPLSPTSLNCSILTSTSQLKRR